MSRYMHSSYYGTGFTPPVVKKLIIANIVLFFIFMLAPRLVIYLGLLPHAITSWHWYWQFFTYMFLHAGFMHILFNMYALWLFGGEVERAIGSSSFLRFYLTTGIGAGVITYLFNINTKIPTVGASGAIWGVLAAYAMMFPNRIILAFFVIPVRAWQFVVFFGLIQLFASISSGVGRGVGAGIAYNAHLGGLAVGFLYIRYGGRLQRFWREFKRRQNEAHRRRSIEREINVHEYIRREIDPILDKISKYGMGSLSRKEKKKLKNAKEYLR